MINAPFAYLRLQRLSPVIYLYEILLGGEEIEKYQANVIKTVQCLEKLRLFFHPDKSIFTPIHNIIFLCYHINSCSWKMFRVRPLKTKYHVIWDVQILLDFLGSVSLDNDVDISMKLNCIFMILSNLHINSWN